MLCRHSRTVSRVSAFAAAGALGLSACAGAGGGGDDGEEGGETTITVATVANPAMQDIEKLLPQFEEDNPDVTVRLITLPENELRDKVTGTDQMRAIG